MAVGMSSVSLLSSLDVLVTTDEEVLKEDRLVLGLVVIKMGHDQTHTRHAIRRGGWIGLRQQ
jgi:hypothetical protein